MAAQERRSKPRKVETKEADEKPQPKGAGLVLLGYFIAAIAIIIGMFVVANFLSANDKDITLLVSFLVALVIAAGLFFWGRMLQKKTA